jgi:hypothetical protein
MEIYLRKSISAGPFRFSLSGSGVGLSVGVKGFQIGRGPRGNYVHMGRGGLYYRTSIDANQQALGAASPLPLNSSGHASSSAPELGSVLDMRPAKASELLDQINERLSRIRTAPGVLILGLLLWAWASLQPDIGNFALLIPLATATLFVVLRRWDQQRKTVVIMYDLDDTAILLFKSFTEQFDILAGTSRVWSIETSHRTSDWKHNAGASSLVARKSAILKHSVPSLIKTNIDVPSILAGHQRMYFFPDTALVLEGSRAGSVAYSDLTITWSTTTFVEDGAVPRDANVIGHTWQFVNKKGGPDRRFKNNRQLPRVNYLEMRLAGPGEFRKLIQFSKVVDYSKFDNALAELRASIKHMVVESDGRTPAELRTSDHHNIDLSSYSSSAQQLALVR